MPLPEYLLSELLPVSLCSMLEYTMFVSIYCLSRPYYHETRGQRADFVKANLYRPNQTTKMDKSPLPKHVVRDRREFDNTCKLSSSLILRMIKPADYSTRSSRSRGQGPSTQSSRHWGLRTRRMSRPTWPTGLGHSTMSQLWMECWQTVSLFIYVPLKRHVCSGQLSYMGPWNGRPMAHERLSQSAQQQLCKRLQRSKVHKGEDPRCSSTRIIQIRGARK